MNIYQWLDKSDMFFFKVTDGVDVETDQWLIIKIWIIVITLLVGAVVSYLGKDNYDRRK